MSTAAFHVAHHLEDELAGYTVATNIFVDKMPNAPDVCISVQNAGGNPDPRGDGAPIELMPIEVRTRAASKAAAVALAEAVYAQLHCLGETSMNETLSVLHCEATSTPALIEVDKQKRAVYLTRYSLEYRASVTY